MRSSPWILLVAASLLLVAGWLGESRFAAGQNESSTTIKGWKRGTGWGWIWGQDDEVGSLNAITDASRAAALRLAERGKVYDLGITYSRRSYKWPGHSPGEIISFRSPAGEGAQKDSVVDAR